MFTVLCIEDEVDIRDIIAEELQAQGYEVREAKDGVEGLQMILRHKPDIVVCDISMPRMTGLELVETLRNDHAQLEHMPFMFLSALTDRPDVLKGIEAGADDYLTKPIDLDLLVTKVAASLRQSQRMIDAKNRQHVKLYNALTKTDHPKPANSKITIPAHKLILVGESNPDIWAVQRQLEEFGQNVHVFTSGRSFLDKIETLEADAILILLQTDDMQGPMVATLNKSRGVKTIVLIPESVGGSFTAQTMNGVHEVVGLPLSDAELGSKLKDWLEC